MRSRTSALAALLALAGVAGLGLAPGAAAAQAAAEPVAAHHEMPQSQILEHQENLERLTVLSQKPGKVGEVATRAIALFKAHTAREAEYILPPLTLLPYLADGNVTPDMAWALAMCDRVRADRDEIFQEHAKVIDVLNELQYVGQQEHDAEAVDFARGAATDALNDVEILEPTVMMIGDVLRAKLGPGH